MSAKVSVHVTAPDFHSRVRPNVLTPAGSHQFTPEDWRHAQDVLSMLYVLRGGEENKNIPALGIRELRPEWCANTAGLSASGAVD